jgi:predicted  nucleic acid-binding Zn-ribbon protein
LSNFQQLIQEKENKISQLQLEINERQKDAPEVIGFGQGKYAREGGAWDSRCESARRTGGGCGKLGGNYFNQQQEKASIWHKQNIIPLENQKSNLNKEIIALEEKQTLPYLRTDLMTTSQELQQLQKDDPLYRQKKTDLSKELLEQAQELDNLEKKYQLFGNIPSLKSEIITPDPVVRTKTELGAINTRPLIIGGIVGLAALFLIWRFK